LIVRRLRERGFPAYFAGGCVRDQLLGKEPQDYDISTAARPEAVKETFAETVEVGAQFGVVLVVLDGDAFEVATFRYDGPYLDGRRPSHVRFADLEEDIFRRDFTINGMFFDPLADRLIDLVGGQRDLEQKLIRAIGDAAKRFEEDRLRMVRAVRFAAGLDFQIEEETLQAIERQARLIGQVAWERLGEEVTRILTEGGARRGFELLDRTGLLEHLLPEITTMKGVEQSPESHPEGDVFRHTLLMLEQLKAPSEALAYGCLLHDVAKPVCAKREAGRITFYGHSEKGAEMAVAILKRLKRSRATWERVEHLVRNHLRAIQAPKMRLSTLKRFLGEDGIDELLELVRADAAASNGDLTYYRFCKEKLAVLREEEIHPKPLLGGKDLIELGLTPGPLFKKILADVEEKQLDGEIATREEALRWVTERHLRPH
jgi:poly(A) polymerase